MACVSRILPSPFSLLFCFAFLFGVSFGVSVSFAVPFGVSVSFAATVLQHRGLGGGDGE